MGSGQLLWAVRQVTVAQRSYVVGVLVLLGVTAVLLSLPLLARSEEALRRGLQISGSQTRRLARFLLVGGLGTLLAGMLAAVVRG
jgi:hypothetical protein